MRALWLKICGLVRRGKVTLAGDDAAPFARAQVSCMGKTKTVEIVFPYGHYANLPEDSLVLMFSVNGQDENASAIGYSPADRFKNLAKGEVLVGNPKTGAFVKFAAGGKLTMSGPADVEIIAAKKVNVTAASDVNVTASGAAKLACTDCTIAASGTVKLGNGAALGVARVGDAITGVTSDGKGVTGTISVGSTKVKSI